MRRRAGSGHLRDRDAYTSAPSARAMRIRRPGLRQAGRMILIALIAACILEKSDSWGPDGKLPLRAETVVSGLEVPWSFAFLPGGDVLVSERPGRGRLLQGGKLLAPPVLAVEARERSQGRPPRV